MPFGNKFLTASSGVPIQLTYDGHPEWKAGSVTIDWSTVAASGTDTVIASEQLTITAGQKYLLTGQVLCQITATGLYGPYDPAAADGRQTPTAGKCGLLNKTVIQNGVLGITTKDNDNTNVIVGGRIWAARAVQAGTGTASLAAGPQLATLLSTLPRLMLAS
jgi:hypothetical protein